MGKTYSSGRDCGACSSKKGVPISLLKKFLFKAKLSKTQTVLLGFASFSRNSGKKISLHFASKVSLRFIKKYVSLQSFASGTVSLQIFCIISQGNHIFSYCFLIMILTPQKVKIFMALRAPKSALKIRIFAIF